MLNILSIQIIEFLTLEQPDMMKYSLLIIPVLTLMCIFWLCENTHLEEKHVEITGGSFGKSYYGLTETPNGTIVLNFDLVDPENAPEALLTKILYGYHLMLNTRQNAEKYTGNELDCNNCHFNAGNTLGGKNRGISLVGVTAMYPRYSERSKKNITLAERIQNCFQRSMNGKELPVNSFEMESILSYLAWISHEVLDAPKLPWLGLEPINSKHVPDAVNGEKVYINNCQICHGVDGEGAKGIPPLWGPNSYNDGAGMNTIKMMAPFVLHNMPRGQPVLTPEEALDVSAYIISKPRPHFKS